MAKISKCVNCKEAPEIVRSDDMQYPHLLRHKLGVMCYPTYRIEIYHLTKKECIDDWNSFNTK